MLNGVPVPPINTQRALVLGHLLGYEQVLADYLSAAAECIREVRRQLRLLDAVSTDNTFTPAPDIPGGGPTQAADDLDALVTSLAGALQDNLDRRILQRFLQGKTALEIADEVYLSAKAMRNRLTLIRQRAPHHLRPRLYRGPARLPST